MTSIQFEELTCLVGPLIVKQQVIREPISVGERLAITLRFVLSIIHKYIFILSKAKSVIVCLVWNVVNLYTIIISSDLLISNEIYLNWEIEGI